MQVIKVTSAAFFTEAVTCEQVCQIALGLGLTQDYVDAMLAQSLKGASKGNGGKGKGGSNGVGNLSCAKLRTIVMQKLTQPNDLVSNFADPAGSFEFEFTGPNFPDLAPEQDINAAGSNKKASGARPRSTNGKLSGAYVVVKCGLKCTEQSDPEKYALWQHVWTSGTFEQYFANAPKKAVTCTGRIITASSEMLWAVKCGWVKPVASE
jgi:hypothetical protein